MNAPERIYLDNAATSWPKPDAMVKAVERYLRELGAPAGRSGYREAAEVERRIRDTRRQLSQFIGADDAQRVVFTGGCTDSLNMAIHGLLRGGDHVVTTVAEHNSVLRPLKYLEDHRQVQVTRVGVSPEGLVDVDALAAAIRPDTRLIALIHASNVTGALQPVEKVAQLAHEHGALFLVDAAQSLGVQRIDVSSMGIDLLAGPAHKGLLGPLGLGVLYVAPGVDDQIESLRQGGTGTQSEDDHQPDALPYKFESGNSNVPGILGLQAGLGYLHERTVAGIRSDEMKLTALLIEGLTRIDGLKVYGPKDPEHRIGVVSVTLDGFDPHEVASTLDAVYSIQVRSGLHCAPLMHRALGTIGRGGTVRLSLGPFITRDHIDRTLAAFDEIARNQAA
jgi:cysteine desulfurase/selenocysteine lyase